MSEMVRADHFEMDVRLAGPSAERVMASVVFLEHVPCARSGGGSNRGDRVCEKDTVGIGLVN